MNYKTPIDEFIPELQTFAKQFIRKARAPNLEVVGNFLTTWNTSAPKLKQMAFKDPRFPQIDQFVGKVTFEDGEWVIESRRISNQKYKRNTPDFNKKKTGDITKAVKIAVDNVVPFAYYEVMLRSDHLINRVIKSWREEGSGYSNIFNDLKYKSIYQEVKRLKDMGIAFVTPEFQRIATEGLDLYELDQIRKSKPVRKFHVLFMDHGRIAVTAQDVDKSGYNEGVQASKVYDAFEQLPEEIASNVAMLKMLNDGDKILGVGLRVSANEFYSVMPLDSNTKA